MESSALGQGVRVLITQFVARTRSVEKFLPRLGERYARELKHLMRTEGTSPVAEVPHTILSLPCVVADQGAALALAKSWHADLVLWGMVGAEPINPVELPANSAGPIAESVSVTASSVQVAGAVITQGHSLSCIGNVNNCHLYVLQAVRHPLESEVVPVVTSRGPDFTEDWDHNDSVKAILDSAHGNLEILNRAQLSIIYTKISDYLFKRSNYQLASHYAGLAKAAVVEHAPASLRAAAVRQLGLSLYEQHATEGDLQKILSDCPQIDTPQAGCRGPLWLAIARLRQSLQKDAEQALGEALRHAKEAEDNQLQGQAYAELAWEEQKRYQHMKALRHYRQSIIHFGAASCDRDEAVVRNDMALLLLLTGQDEEAESLFHRVIAIHHLANRYIAEATSRYNLASLFRKKGNIHDAISQFEIAADVYARASPPDYNAALNSLTQAVLLTQGSGSPEKLRRLLLAQQALATRQAHGQ